MSKLKIAVIVGSLRKESFNKKLAVAVTKLFPAEVETYFVEINKLPLFNQDEETNPNAAVDEFKNAVAAADGVIFVTPEYNRSIPGVLKNALDVGSRPYGKSVWGNKPAGIIGTSTGGAATALAQQHLKNTLAFLNMPLLNQPEAYIHWQDDLISANDEINARSKAFIQSWVDSYIAWVEKHKS